ncbi:MAG: efflux RND transporter periplasmic adaptor subunit [Acidobacteriota bacterium]
MQCNRPRAAFRATAGIALVSSAALFSLVLTACHSSGDSATAKAASIPSARVAAAQRGTIRQVLTLAGQFQPYQEVDVHPKVSGYMKKINVDIGDIVHEGQTLAVLEVPELRAQLQQTVFEVNQANEEITRAQHDINRAEAQHAALHAEYKRLLQASQGHPGLIAQQEIDDAQAKDLSSEAQVDAAQAAMAAAQEHKGAATADHQKVQALHNYTNVVAPISGVVVWRYADTGALIQSGTNSNSQDLPIVRLSQSTLLRLRLPVPETDVQYVHEGDTVDLRVDALNRNFTGKIVRFTREVNFATRTMETEVDLENKDLSIAPGMYANAMLQLAQAQDVVTVPIEAVVIKGDQRVVYALGNDNHVHMRQVQVGLEGNKLAEIRSGLEPGDRVILGGQDKYQEDEEVRPIVTTEPASEVMQQTGGTIDLKGDEAMAASNGPDALEEHKAGRAGVHKKRAKDATVNSPNAKEPDAKHIPNKSVQ